MSIAEAVKAGDLGKVRRLLEEGHSPNSKDYLDNPILYVALSNGHADVAKLLIERGASVRFKSRLGRWLIRQVRTCSDVWRRS